MTSNRAKGNRSERLAVEELEKEGYLVYRVKGSTKWNTNVDIFSLWDIIAIKKNESKLIQVKTNIFPNPKEYEIFKQKYPQFICEIWVWQDYTRNGFKKKIVGE